MSAFCAVLERLCRLTGAEGAALVDREGETVDYAGSVDPFEIKVAAAEWRIVLAAFAELPVVAWRSARELCVRAARRSFHVLALDDHYALVVLAPRGALCLSPRALSEAATRICSEAGLSPTRRHRRDRWWSVNVRSGQKHRPFALQVGDAWHTLDVLGRCADPPLTRGEVGYRVRVSGGAELTLVRERLGHWYSDLAPPEI